MADGSTRPGWARSGHLVSTTAPAALEQSGILDRLRIMDVVHRYAWCYDERDLEGIADIVADDVRWVAVVGGVEMGRRDGREALLQWFAEDMAADPPLRRHTMTNLTFVHHTAESAQVIVYLTLHELNTGEVRVAATGFYRIDLRRRGSEWQFASVLAGFDRY